MSSTTDLDWFKSSYSSAQGDSCVEMAVGAEAVHVRDSKDVTRRPFAVGREEWARFLTYAVQR
jgi:uncharacterized protein DUF397